MSTIGTFTKQEDGFNGTLKTLSLNVKLKIVPITKDNNNGPDYRVLAGAMEIGAAWPEFKDLAKSESLSGFRHASA
jgi:uncharacterized protein (DUF736 family)